ncbi:MULTISPECIES: hypothetical protein [unclassified Psychrobacter]|uniref:hypothetical protein n=1 Tax=unclassified Psychrobacter TaxID=196806 RepID=UPI003FD32E25
MTTPNNDGMKSQKSRPTFSRYSKPKRQPTQILWIAIALIIAIIILAYLLWLRSTADNMDEQGTTIDISTVEEQIRAAQPVSSPVVPSDKTVDDDSVNSTNSPTIDTLNDNDTLAVKTIAVPSPKKITEAPLPKTNSLAKEEIDRLKDEKQRFAEQERLAAEQIAMTKQLTQMKAEQIALLETQIAQLEAQKLEAQKRARATIE